MADQQTPAEVAQQAEDVRADLSHTLELLRENMKPEHVIEEVVSNARIGADTVAESLYALARQHPLPALLIGAGCAMVMGYGSRSGVKRTRLLELSPARPRTAPLGPISNPLLSKGHTPVNEMTERFQTPASKPGSRLSSLLNEQPLILAALGVAVGAAIGAALPHTQAEDEWMGSASASVKNAAQDAAQNEIKDLKAVAARTAENMRQSAADHGLSSENLSDLVRDVGDHAKSAVHDVGTGA